MYIVRQRTVLMSTGETLQPDQIVPPGKYPDHLLRAWIDEGVVEEVEQAPPPKRRARK